MTSGATYEFLKALRNAVADVPDQTTDRWRLEVLVNIDRAMDAIEFPVAKRA